MCAEFYLCAVMRCFPQVIPCSAALMAVQQVPYNYYNCYYYSNIRNAMIFHKINSSINTIVVMYDSPSIRSGISFG